ncbi:MAG: hypothetical protein IT238_07455 [Bacteroidia bacterium]|nr:hypothetical protein [Bacteroidia bacterium]
MTTKSVLIICLISFAWLSCLKKETASPVPEIEFKDIVTYKDSANLFIGFIDGDGDIGLTQNDTIPPNNYNLFITYIEKQKGQWVYRELPADFNYRIPVINSSGKKKKIQGVIKVAIQPYYYDPFSSYDTIKYEIYITDKALNKSNIISTPEVIISK